MIKACIFDLDGTIGDTRMSMIYSVNEALKELKLPTLPDEEIVSYVGNGAKYLVERVAEAVANPSRFEEIFSAYMKYFSVHCSFGATAYEGIREMLADLKKEGILLAVLSNKPHEQTKKVIYDMFGDEIFDVVMGQREGIKRKPAPDGVYAVLEKLHLSKEEVLYIGDSDVDIDTAEAAKVSGVYVSWGFKGREFLEQKGAKDIIDNPKEVLQFIMK